MALPRTPRLLAPLVAAALLSACAGNAPDNDRLAQRQCPSDQVLVCKGGDVNSRVKDSKLNTKDVCICRQQDPF